MPRKLFEESPYDPIAADLMREVAVGGRGDMARVVTSPPRSLVESSPPLLNLPRAIPAVPVIADTSAPHTPEPPITKRFTLTRSENEELDAFMLRLQKRAGTKVTLSMFTRAVINVAMQAEEQLLAEVGEGVPRRFPSTHDSIAQGAFEEWWMRCLGNALRKIPRSTTMRSA